LKINIKKESFMAKIVEEILVIKLSRLTKDGELPSLINAELQTTVESVVQELVGENVVVEIVTE